MEWLQPTRSHVAIRLLSFVVRWVNCKDHSPRLYDLQTLLNHLRSPHAVTRTSNTPQGDNDDATKSSVYRKTRRRGSSTDATHTNMASTVHQHIAVTAPVFRPINISGVLFSPPRTNKGLLEHWTVSRQPLSGVDLQTNTMDISTNQLKARSAIDIIWDQRFFLRILAHDGVELQRTIHIRPMTLDDARLARQTLKTSVTNGHKAADQLELFMDNVPGKSRLTIPVLTVSSSLVPGSETLVSIPTLGVHFATDLLQVECRLKSGNPNFDIPDE